jgi:hypothetical protein
LFHTLAGVILSSAMRKTHVFLHKKTKKTVKILWIKEKNYKVKLCLDWRIWRKLGLVRPKFISRPCTNALPTVPTALKNIKTRTPKRPELCAVTGLLIF